MNRMKRNLGSIILISLSGFSCGSDLKIREVGHDEIKPNLKKYKRSIPEDVYPIYRKIREEDPSKFFLGEIKYV